LVLCQICHREFKSLRSLSHHLVTHNMDVREYYDRFLKKPDEGTCIVCGRPAIFKGLKYGYLNYCSSSCSLRSSDRMEKLRKTCLERYGVENPSQIPKAKEKKKQTFLERYNVEYPSQSKEIRQKIKQSVLEHYRVEHPAQALEVRNKTKETCLQNLGVPFPMQSLEVRKKSEQTLLDRYNVVNISQVPHIKEKTKETWRNKYGVSCPLKSPEIREKSKKTCLEKYGVEYSSKAESVKDKIKNTVRERYGVDYFSQSFEFKEKVRRINLEKFQTKLSKYLGELQLQLVDEPYQGSTYKHRWKCLECGTEFEQIWNLVQQDYRCPTCYPRQTGTSKQEQEVADFVKKLGFEIFRNDRTLIKPLELDIVVPARKVAIEYDGNYWHSEEAGIDPNYHLMKTELCENIGYRLIHIFEDEWVLKKDIVKSRLKYILNKTKECFHIGARNCVIEEISPEQKNDFLERYHIQGPDGSKVKLGAFYNNELVAVMTFSHGSLAKGIKKQDPLVWELNRFCTHPNYVISGIASKLLKYFKRHYEWKEIFSYADRRWSQGNMYKQLGFDLVHQTTPNYWYINGIERLHRFALRKRSTDPKDIPEWLLRLKEGYVRLWDCGSLKFVLS